MADLVTAPGRSLLRVDIDVHGNRAAFHLPGIGVRAHGAVGTFQGAGGRSRQVHGFPIGRELDPVGPMAVVGIVFIPEMGDISRWCAGDDGPDVLGAGGNGPLDRGVIVRSGRRGGGLAVCPGTQVLSQGDEAHGPAGLLGIPALVVAGRIGHAGEIHRQFLSGDGTQADDIETRRLRCLGRIHLPVAAAIVGPLPGDGSRMAGTLGADLLEIPGGNAGGIVIDLRIEFVDPDPVSRHVGLQCVLRLPGRAPDIGHGVDPVLVHPVVVEEVAAVTHVLMGEMPVAVVAEFSEVIVRKGLFRDHLVGLPLGRLLPEGAALALVVTEGHAVNIAGLVVQLEVTGRLVLEGMTDLVGHGGTAVRCLGIHPQAAGDVVVRTGAVGRPLGLVPQVNLELVLVQIRLVRVRVMREFERIDIVRIDFLAPGQEGIRVQVVRSRRIIGRRRLVVLVPEEDEMLALLAASEEIQAGTFKRVVERAARIGVPVLLVEFGAHVYLLVVRDIRRGEVRGRDRRHLVFPAGKCQHHGRSRKQASPQFR